MFKQNDVRSTRAMLERGIRHWVFPYYFVETSQETLFLLFIDLTDLPYKHYTSEKYSTITKYELKHPLVILRFYSFIY